MGSRTMPKDSYSVLVLGLDGATFDLILPWVEQGYLPCLGRLLREGSSSPLRSTIPPITPCAWSSFMTGKNPGKHGLFDFVEPLPDGRGVRFTNASCRSGESLWGYLSRKDRRVGIINVPMTYPPEPVNGYLISGLDTPHERSAYMYPSTLRDELSAESIGYRIELQHLGNMRTNARRDRQLAELREVESIRTRTLKHLSSKYPADFRMLVYGATDQVAHHFWHYMDERHDKYDAEGAERYRHAIRDVYQHVDGLLASVLEDEGDDTIVAIMSDHGFGPTTNVRLRLNQILEHAGLLAFVPERQSGRLKRVLAGLVDRALRSTLSADAKRTIAGLFPRLRDWFERLDEAQIDWTKTIAYTNEAYRSDPAVWLNHTRRNPQGLLKTEAEIKDALEKVENVLRDLKDPLTGRPAISNVYRTEEIYRGPYLDAAPDLIPSWWEDGFLLEQSTPGGPAELRVERSEAPLAGGVEFAGSHRRDGVLIMAGGPMRENYRFTGADITDVAPTVLYAMGLPIPDDMDGRVLTEAFESDFIARREPEHEAAEAMVAVGHHQAFSHAEEALIAKRLQSLGYIE